MRSNFPSLESLDVRTSIVEFGKNLLQWCDNTPLRKFYFFSGAIATNLVVSDFLVTLRDHCGHYNLTSIVLQFGKTSLGLPGDATHYKMTPTVLRPLLVFCNLSYLRVSSPHEFCLDDDFVETMSTAWPKLRCLTFDVSTRDHDTASSVGGSVTIAALVSFARRCPDLYELQIDLDANVVPAGPHPSPRGPRVRQMNLKYLTLWASPIESPSLVAHFLSSIFPCLRDIDVCHEHGLDEAEEEELHREGRSRYHKWVEVAKLVPLLAAARSDEEVFWSTNSAKKVSETV
jgi:hypothetical protein